MNTRKELSLDTDKWDKVLVKGKYNDYTKEDVHSYYENPNIKKAMMKEVKDSPVLLKVHTSPQAFFWKRYTSGGMERKSAGIQPIKLMFNGVDVNDPSDFSYHTHRRTIEFHRVYGPITDRYVVDVDPGSRIDEMSKKRYVQAISNVVGVLPEVKNVRIRFSGGPHGGFYVEGFLKKSMNTDTAKANLKNHLGLLVDNNKTFTFNPPRDNQIRLDLSTFHEFGSIKALYSLDGKTGLASIPVDDLSKFHTKDADLKNVLGGNIIPQKRLRE